MKFKLIKDLLRPPYDKNGNTTFNKRYKIGVYMIYENDKLQYVGYSGRMTEKQRAGLTKPDLYKALYRHFQDWRDKYQQRITFNPNTAKVRVIYCNNRTTADKLEKALIIKLKPPKNPLQYSVNYDMDKKEEEVLNLYNNTKVIDIQQFADENLPF